MLPVGILVTVVLLSCSLDVEAGGICLGEQNGNIAVEAESGKGLFPSFVRNQSVPGHSGSGYITYRGKDRADEPFLSEAVEYKVYSPFGGNYNAHLRTLVEGASPRTSLDNSRSLWLNVPLRGQGRQWIEVSTSHGALEPLWVWQRRVDQRLEDASTDVYFVPGFNRIFVSGGSPTFSLDKLNFVKKISNRDDQMQEVRVDCHTGIPVVAGDEKLSTCEALLSNLLVDLYETDFNGRDCKFIAVELFGKALCSGGVCSGLSDDNCRANLRPRIHTKLSQTTVCGEASVITAPRLPSPPAASAETDSSRAPAPPAQVGLRVAPWCYVPTEGSRGDPQFVKTIFIQPEGARPLGQWAVSSEGSTSRRYISWNGPEMKTRDQIEGTPPGMLTFYVYIARDDTYYISLRASRGNAKGTDGRAVWISVDGGKAKRLYVPLRGVEGGIEWSVNGLYELDDGSEVTPSAFLSVGTHTVTILPSDREFWIDAIIVSDRNARAVQKPLWTRPKDADRIVSNVIKCPQ